MAVTAQTIAVGVVAGAAVAVAAMVPVGTTAANAALAAVIVLGAGVLAVARPRRLTVTGQRPHRRPDSVGDDVLDDAAEEGSGRRPRPARCAGAVACGRRLPR